MDLSDGAAELLHLVRDSELETRASIARRTGWARGTVNARLDELLALGLIADVGSANGSRGRPATRFAFAPGAGSLLVADVGASAARLAHCDLAGTVLAHHEVALDITAGPDTVLGTIVEGLRALPTGGSTVWAAGISLPGPIEQPSGRVVSPPIMTGFDGLDVPAALEPRLGVPVLVENDANAMAWGERVISRPGGRDLLFVKVGTGIGAGIVANGQILVGARGAAGDLGHTHVEPLSDRPVPLCRCGKSGCVEAYVGGWAIARDLAQDGLDVADASGVVALVDAGDAHAIRRVREAGRVLGKAVASAVSLLNPSEIVIGGHLSVAGEHLLAGIREQVATASLPLATRDLTIRVSRRPHDVGVVGLVDAVTTWVLDPANLPRVLDRVNARS